MKFLMTIEPSDGVLSVGKKLTMSSLGESLILGNSLYISRRQDRSSGDVAWSRFVGVSFHNNQDDIFYLPAIL